MFMKKIFLFAFTSLLSVSLLAQDKVINDANAEARNVSSFHGIKVSHGIELVIKQGNAEAVAVSASEKQYRDRIKTEVVNGILKIYYENEKWYKGWSTNGKRLKAYVSFKQLDLVDGSSGSSTTIEGTMNAGDLKIDLSSGAGFSGSVQANRLTVDESSGATAHINGKAQSVSVETSSGAGFYGYDLISDKCDADASSGGSIEINVSKELSADASSGGDIRYRGNGVITKISTSSGGSVKSSR
jgi:Putative auto-transporter adhesin, head GIN domain